jgi:hypothetical protein
MKNYIVGVTIYNAFHIEAETPEDARQQVRDMDTLDILDDADFNITYTDEQKGGEE